MQKAVSQGFRLSPQQQHVWWAQRGGDGPAFVVQTRIDIAGALDRQRLARALEQAVERHEILRTTFPLLPGLSVPVQSVEDSAWVDWSERSLADLPTAEREAALGRLGGEIRETPFDLVNGPLLRATLIAVEGERHALLLSQPALAADGISLDLLATEVAAAYHGVPADGEALQYADLAELLHEWQGSPADAPGPAFWRAQDLSALTRVPLGQGGLPNGQPFQPDHVSRRIDRAPVEEAAARLGGTISLILLAGWHATLHLSTGEEEIVVGTLFDGRTCEELESALGPFARYLPVRARTDAGSTLADLSRVLSATVADVARRQDFFSSESVARLLAEHGASGWPFGFDDRRPRELSAMPGAPTFAIGDGHLELDRFGLRLSVLDDGQSLRADLAHDPVLFSRDEAERVLERLVRVLDGLLAGARLGEVDVLTAAERQQVLLGFNRTESPVPAGLCAHHLFEEQARRVPHAPALVHAGQTWTYAELDSRSGRLAAHLRAAGLGPGALVGVCIERSTGLVETLLGILRAGAAYVPLDPGYPADRLCWMAEDAGISLLLTQESLQPLFCGASVRTLRLEELADGRGDLPHGAQVPPRSASPADLAYVIYTSGSMGRPKGVMIPHRGLVNYLLWARQAYAASEGMGAPVHSAIGFDLTVTSLLVPLASGTAVTLLNERRSVEALVAALREAAGFSLVKLTPAHLDVLRRELDPGELAGRVRALVIGGEALRAESVAPWREHAPETRLINEYGPTEATVGCCVHEIAPGDAAEGPVAIGRPIANTRLYIVGSGLWPVPPGAPGELWIGGDSLARGYLGRPELTAGRFVPDPFAAETGKEGERLYRTGDLVRLRPDGLLDFLGRIDDQLKIRGFRIEPGEIEAALATHPKVLEAAVVAREDDHGKRLVAYAVPRRQDERPAASELRRHLEERLPDYMVPAVFVVLDGFPLTPNGKLDRRALPDPGLQGREEAPYTPPRTLSEEVLTEIWGQVLGVDRVGIDDHFFSLGGDSIRSLQILALAQKRGLGLTLQDLFQRPTIRSLAERVRLPGQNLDASGQTSPFSLIAPQDLGLLPAGIEDAYPLAHLQSGMLFHSDLAPGTGVYHDLHSFRLRGRYHHGLLTAAIEQTIRRHPVLRTSFDLASFSEPLQLVWQHIPVPLTAEDLRDLSPERQREAVSAWLEAERNRGFAWSQPPLVCFHVQQLGENLFQFTLSFHHSVLDGWSAASLLTELFQLYTTLLQGGQIPATPPPSATFRDFVELERRLLASSEARQFWARQLDGSTLDSLPRRRTRDAEARARILELPIPEALDASLKRLARAAAVPLKSALLAAHFRVLTLLTGRDDVVTGIFANGRPERDDGDQVLGLFLNTLPLRLRLPGGTWNDLVQAAFALELQTLPFRCFPLAELQRMRGRQQLFETACNFLHYHVYQRVQGVAGLEVLEGTGYEETNFVLEAQFSIQPATGRLQLAINYRTSELEGDQVEAIGGYYLRALNAMAANPAGVYDGAYLLSEAERQQMLVEWGSGGASAGPLTCFDPLFAEQARRTPEAVAIALGDLRLTYSELDRRVGRMARALALAGVGPEEVVPLLADRGPDFLTAVLALFRAGGAYLPLDPLHPVQRIVQILASSGAGRLIVSQVFAPALARALDRGAGAPQLLVLEDLLAVEDRPDDGSGLSRRSLPSNLAYVIYTSGSTGVPKGAMLEQRGMVNHLWAKIADLELDASDRVAQTASQCFDISVWQFLSPLLVGGQVQVFPDEVAHDALRLLQEIEQHGITLLETVPSLLRLLLAELDRRGEEDRPAFQRLRWLIPTGEALPPDLCRDWLRLYPAVPLLNAYGPTECSDDVTHYPIPAPPQLEETRVPIGRPVPGLALQILSSWLQPLPAGVAGELFVGGAGVGRGYIGDGARTADSWRPDPFSGELGARLYRTGDLARFLPAGEIEYLGRIDHQVKVRGQRIELGEVEAALLALADVREAVAVVRDDTPGDQRLVAYVVGGATVEELRQSLRERLPDSMVPAAFVSLAALPLTPNGKVDRKALPAPEWQGTEESYLAPRTPVEEVLAGIWAELLGLDRVGSADHFFELGGHSLLATRVMSRLRAAFGVEMPLRDLFEAPMLADLAVRIEEALRAGAGQITPPLIPVPREGPVPLSFAQQRLWFIDQLEPGLPLYNVPAALRVEGPLDAAVLALCLGEIVRRHETLRTVFAMQDGSPVQVIQAAAPIGLTVIDLSGLPEREREALALALAGEETLRPFDLVCGPLLRGVLLRLTEGDHIVTLTMHHIVSDGWSMGILVREATALYAAFAEGRSSPLPELPVQYADFSAWQRSWLHGEVLENEFSFWRRQLAGLPPRLELPTDRPRPAVQSFRGASRRMQLSADLTRQAQALSRRSGATLFMVLLAGFQVLLARCSGQEDLAVGTPVAGRNRIEIEGLIGFFVNTLVLRGDLSGEPSFRQLLGRARETALAAHTHQDLPFEKLVQELSPERSLAQSPLFQVMLVLQNAPTESLDVRSLRLRPVGGAGTTAKFDLLLSLAEHNGGLSGTVEHSTDLFDGTTIDRLIGHLERLLAAASAAPELRVSELPLLSEAERGQILVEWNDTRSAPASRASVLELFAAQSRRAPDAVAAVFGTEKLIYAELDARANRLARHLRRLGVGPDVLVGLLVERSLDMVVGVLGILQAGGAYAPLDPEYPEKRLALMLEDTRSPVVLTQKHLRGRLPAGASEVVLLDEEDGSAAARDSWAPAEPLPESLAYVTFTSGSTGRPKGVALSHGALRNLIDWHLATCLGGVTTLQFASLSFDVSFYEMFACWGSGGRLVVVPEALRRDMPALAGLLVEQRIEKAILPVVVLQDLAELFAGCEDLPALREITTTGERLQTNRAMAAMLRRLPGCVFHNHYGPSETHVATACTLSLDPEDWAVYPSIGRAIWNSTTHVLEPGLEPAPVGVPGDLYIGGACLARGYLGRPDLTAQKFVPDPFGPEPGSRLYRTGDKVRLSTRGDLDFLGRFDDQVKIRGFRIELGEIEAALLALAGVREAVVVAREDRSGAGSGDRRLVAYVVGEVATAKLRQFLRERLPDPMVPAAFVTLAALPLTPNRKVDRKALPAPEWQSTGETYRAPRTPVEEVIAGIWAELLGLERVGAADHFFELGGHSLLATRVMSRLRAAFHVEMPLRDLFEAPVLADLAARVEEARKAGVGRLAPPLVPVPREEPLPLSFAQQRLWFIDQLEPGRPVYNIPVALRIEGLLDPAVLALCLGEIVRRHEALRTVFAAREGSPAQVIQPAAPFGLAEVDLSGLPDGEREALALTVAGEEAVRPFDLVCGPLLRGLLLRLSEGDHVIALTLHHIVSDGWSMGILIREVTALYAAFTEGRPSPLPELPVQYADFAAWQHSWLHGEVLENEISFWRRQLAGLPPRLELPTDRPRPAVQSFRGASRRLQLPAGLTRQAQALSRREGMTLFMVLLAGFQALLARSSGQDDLAVGTPVAGRNQMEIEGLIGFFVNTLVLRGDLTGDPSFRELLGRTRETALAAHMHQDVPFEKLVQELTPERSLSHTPFFQVMLVLQNAPIASLEVRNLSLRPLGGAGSTAKFDLTLSLEEWNGSLLGTVEHATDLFDATTIDRLMIRYERLLTAALAEPDRAASELPLLGEAERHQTLEEWNDTRVDWSVAPLLPPLLAAQAARAPERIAVEQGSRALTAGELEARANRLAHLLLRRGVRPDDRVAICCDRSPEMVVSLLAVWKAGAAWVPLDPASPAARRAAMLDDARPALLVTGPGAPAELLPEDENNPAHVLDLAAVEAELAATTWEGATPPEIAITPEHLAYVIYTSGSTGRPKGVLVAHGAIANRLLWMQRALSLSPLGPLGETDAVLQKTPYIFDAAIWEIFLPLLAVARLVLATPGAHREPAAMAQEVRERGVTVLQLVPSVLGPFLDEDLRGSSLRRLFCGGEALPVPLCDRVFEHLPGVKLYNLYGPTECAIDVIFHMCQPGEEAAGNMAAIAPLGRPLDNVQARIMDWRWQPVPLGQPGELCAGGAGLARGYLGRPDLTAERFVPDPCAATPGARLYRTGDLVRQRPDGTLHFLGRIDHQVKIRGFRIELGEVEAALSALAGVRQAAVILREDAPGAPRLVAYVAGDVERTTDALLRQQLRERLPEAMVPAVFVTIAALPLTPTGKVDRKALPAPEWHPSGEGALEPRTPVEEVLAGIWAELLGLERVGADDQFFHLGGHSLLATRVMSRLRSAFDVEMPLRDLFEAPRLADLAARVEAARRTGAGPLTPPLVPALRAGDLPLSFAQQRLWFLDQLLPGDPAYSLPAALRVVGALDREALAKAFAGLVARHEVLRTSFGIHDGEPVQRIAPPDPVAIPFIDLAGLPADRAEAEVHRLAAEEAQRPFDLARGPLLRVTLVQLGDREHALLLNLHHIIADAWSIGIMIRELTALYASSVRGTTALLPELPVQYADYAVWQRDWLRDEALEEQLAWWRRELAGSTTSLDLPLDQPRPAVSSHRGGQVALALSAELSPALEALSRRHGATLFMILLAGWSALLSRYASQEDVLVGSSIANRTRLETERLIGFFVNTLVLRTDLSGDPGLGKLVARVRRATLGAYDHQDLPFERLVEELAPERSLQRSPLFQVLFGLQNAPVETIDMAGLELRPLRIEGKTAKFDLSLSLTEVAGRLHASLAFNADLFDRTTAERLLGHFQILLTAAAADPSSRLSDLPLLTAAEAEQLSREAETSRRATPDVALAVPRLFAEIAARMPTAAAVTGAGADLTFGELHRWSSWLAGLLRREGIGLEQRVAVCAEPSAALVAGVLAVLGAGGVWVPLDPAHPEERLAGILEDSGASLLLLPERLADRLAGLGARTLFLDSPEISRQKPRSSGEEVAIPLEAAAYVIYTSGTTGRPKGTVVNHRSLAGYLTWFNRRFAETGTRPIPCLSSPGFDASLKQLLAPLLRGEAVWIVPPGVASRPNDLLSEIAARGGAALNCVPSLWRVLLEQVEAGRGMEDALRHLLLGGEALDPSLAERTLAALPGIEIWNLYGPTEATANASCASVAPGRTDIGHGVAGAALHVVDRHLQLMPVGVPGELTIAGSGLARGYLSLPAVTAERFVPNPFSSGPGERLYHTGDRARVLPDGAIELLGRLDHQVKIRGFRLEPGEVEAALCRHPAVAQAVVAAWESTPEDRPLAAWVVPVAGSTLDPAELRAHLRTVLPEPMVPSAWIVLPFLPLTPNGKVDRAALPSPERAAAAAASYEEPRSAAEREIAEIWREILGAERVGLHDNFFDLGGHSLLMVRVQSRLSRHFGRDITMVDLFSHPTVSSLARLLADAEETSPTPVRSAGQEERMASGKERLRRLRQGTSERRAR